MRKKMSKRLVAMCIAAATVMASLSGCGQPDSGKETTQSSTQQTQSEVTPSTGGAAESTEETVVDKSELPTLTLFGADAGVPGGLVEGFRGDYLAENGFNLEVWSYSAEKLVSIVNSGDLPDIMIIKKGENLDALIENGQIINFDDYLDKLPNLFAKDNAEEQKTAIETFKGYNSNGTGGLYGIPLNVGDFNDVYGFDKASGASIMLNWKIYEEIGAPKINSYSELLDVMEQMMKAHPEAEDGTKIWGTTMDAGYDMDYWGCMWTWLWYQGYHYNFLPYMISLNLKTDEAEYIFSKDSKYYEGVKWYNEAYRRGLFNPDDINTDRATQIKKVDSGYAMVGLGTVSGYAPIYYPYYIPGTNIYAKSTESNFSNVIVVNAETEYLDECLDFVNMWIDPDTFLELEYGASGVSTIWYEKDGVAHLTDEFKAHLAAGNPINSFKMSDGTEFTFFNTQFGGGAGVYTSYVDAEGNPLQGGIAKWPEYIQTTSTDNPTLEAWKKTMGYDSMTELLEDKGAFFGDADYNYYRAYLNNPSDDAMKLQISALNDIVVNGCWKCVYAETEAEFDALWDKMVADAEAGGAKDIYKWKVADIAQAKKIAGK